MCHHWKQENIHFSNELANWRKFRKYQQDHLQHLDHLETGLELRNLDASLTNALTSLSDWQDFEAFQYHNLTDVKNFEDHCRQKFLEITEWKASTEQSSSSSPPHGVFGAWLYSFNRNQEAIEAANKQLKWIRDQWPKVATEVCASVSMTPKLQSSLEASFEKQTRSAFSAIQKLGGCPSHAVSPPKKSMDVLHRILYWISETSKYTDELLHWKHFFKRRQGKLGKDSTMQRDEYQCPKFESVLQYSAMVQESRQYEHETALIWLERWRRVVTWYEDEIKAPRWRVVRNETSRQESPPRFLYVYAEAARSHVRRSEQAVVDAAAWLEKSRQEHVHALSEHGQSLGDETAMECPQKPCLITLSLADSKSPRPSHSSSFSSLQLSISSPSPSSASSGSSQPSVPPQSPQTSRSTPSTQSSVRMRKGRGQSDKGSSADKRHRRSNKKNARKKEAKIRNIDIEQQALPTFVPDSHNVEDDEHAQMGRAPEDSSQSESIEKSCEVESEDTVMTECDDAPTPTISLPLQSSSLTPITKFKKLPLPAQGPTQRKTRSAIKLDQATSRVLKNTNKKSAKKAKRFIEQQAMTLLDFASDKGSTTIGPPLRRSERLKEKAVMSAATAGPQLHAGQPSQQKQPQETRTPSEFSESSTQKKRKREPHKVEPLPESARPKQKKRRTQ